LNPEIELQSDKGVSDLVSVIIPAYNAVRYIKETLESVFSQTYKHYQIIVVNDGSPDTPELDELLLPYMYRITYIKQENRGLAGARNTGLRAATGNLVAFLDADDIWMPEYLAEQTKFLSEHPEYDLVYCNARFFGDSVYDGMEYMKVCPSEGEATAVAIISRRCHVFVSATARREAMLAVAFDESLRSCEDFDCWLRFTSAGYRIGYHRKILVRYRKHGASLSASPVWMAENNIRVLNKSSVLWPEVSEECRLLLEAKNNKVAELDTIRGKMAIDNQDFSTAAVHLEQANCYYKSAKISLVVWLLKRLPWLVGLMYRSRAMLFRSYRDV